MCDDGNDDIHDDCLGIYTPGNAVASLYSVHRRKSRRGRMGRLPPPAEIWSGGPLVQIVPPDFQKMQLRIHQTSHFKRKILLFLGRGLALSSGPLGGRGTRPHTLLLTAANSSGSAFANYIKC